MNGCPHNFFIFIFFYERNLIFMHKKNTFLLCYPLENYFLWVLYHFQKNHLVWSKHARVSILYFENFDGLISTACAIVHWETDDKAADVMLQTKLLFFATIKTMLKKIRLNFLIILSSWWGLWKMVSTTPHSKKIKIRYLLWKMICWWRIPFSCNIQNNKLSSWVKR